MGTGGLEISEGLIVIIMITMMTGVLGISGQGVKRSESM